MCVQEGISGYLIPVFIREIQTRRFPLNASAIDENVYLTIHQVEGLLEEIFDGVEIIEVAVSAVPPKARMVSRVCRFGEVPAAGFL